MTLFPVKSPIRVKRKPITAKNVMSIMPCTFERAHQVFIGDHLDAQSKEYERLRRRLSQVWKKATGHGT